MLQSKRHHESDHYRTTVRLSSTGRSRLKGLQYTYQSIFGQRVSNAVLFHRALASLEDQLNHLTVNHSPQDVAASERVMFAKS